MASPRCTVGYSRRNVTPGVLQRAGGGYPRVGWARGGDGASLGLGTGYLIVVSEARLEPRDAGAQQLASGWGRSRDRGRGRRRRRGGGGGGGRPGHRILVRVGVEL